MKLNNKGVTLIEIVVSIVLISIVLIFIAMLLIDVKDINDESSTNASYLINKALLTKIIEEDLMKYEKIEIEPCNGVINLYNQYDVSEISDNKNKFSECLKIRTFIYGDEASATEIEPAAYIGLYYLNTRNSYVISYIHGDISRTTKDFNDFDKYNINNSGLIKNNSLKMYIEYDNIKYYYDEIGNYEKKDEIGALTINIPMIGSDGKDHSIVIPYYGKLSITKGTT